MLFAVLGSNLKFDQTEPVEPDCSITTAITIAVSTNAFIAALKEYEEDLETETDGEDGE